MSGICDACHREPCHMKMDGLRMCDMHEGGETRWHKLFGTPERAARTLAGFCADCYGWCPECGVPGWMTSDPNALLGWLRGESDGK